MKKKVKVKELFFNFREKMSVLKVGYRYDTTEEYLITKDLERNKRKLQFEKRVGESFNIRRSTIGLLTHIFQRIHFKNSCQFKKLLVDGRRF